MQTARDSYLRLGVRQHNLLRLEQLRRVCSLRSLLRRAVLRCLRRDAGLRQRQQTWAARLYAKLPRSQSPIRHNTRCRMSGRTRQTFRRTQLARMHYRQHFAEGRLYGYRLGRS